jgi:hypothetical protein
LQCALAEPITINLQLYEKIGVFRLRLCREARTSVFCRIDFETHAPEKSTAGQMYFMHGFNLKGCYLWAGLDLFMPQGDADRISNQIEHLLPSFSLAIRR